MCLQTHAAERERRNGTRATGARARATERKRTGSRCERDGWGKKKKKKKEKRSRRLFVVRYARRLQTVGACACVKKSGTAYRWCGGAAARGGGGGRGYGVLSPPSVSCCTDPHQRPRRRRRRLMEEAGDGRTTKARPTIDVRRTREHDDPLPPAVIGRRSAGSFVTMEKRAPKHSGRRVNKIRTIESAGREGRN